MSALTETVTRTPVRDFLTGLLNDAYGYRLPEGDCVRCIASDTNRCADHQKDHDEAQEYLRIFRAVDGAGDDEEAFLAFTAALPEAGRS